MATAVPRIGGKRLDARPDTVDFRDLMYVPTLVDVPPVRPLAHYQRLRVPLLDQGREGSCTGFGLATAVHYLLRTRAGERDRTRVSAHMLYAMARRYDEWPGEDYEGSSCRGAIKGWHKHGVCSEPMWKELLPPVLAVLTAARASSARDRPLGAYFRVNHKDLVALHAAISEVGALYVSCAVHSGWQRVSADGRIPWRANHTVMGGHAFAVVAYDRDGFWLQNSWGSGWGRRGFAHLSYDDWLKHGSDAWVARLGVPVQLAEQPASGASAFSVSASARAIAYDEVRPHVISVGNDGRFKPSGPIGTTAASARAILREDFLRITTNWRRRRLLLYAHGGLVDEEAAVQRLAEYRAALLPLEIYPLAFVWHSGLWTTLGSILNEALRRRRPEGPIGDAKDFLLDRLDDALEPIARLATGKAAWDEMKENALAATVNADGAARFVAHELRQLAGEGVGIELHLVGHSAGSIFHAPLARMLTAPPPAAAGSPPRAALAIASCSLWAPACTRALFHEYYAPLLQHGIERFRLYTLTDAAERADHCAHVYHKSLLYLVSHAFESRARIPLLRPAGEAILGMEKFVTEDAALMKLLRHPANQWIKSPNTLAVGQTDAAGSTEHGAFDDDEATFKGTVAHLLGAPVGSRKLPTVEFASGRSRLQKQRRLVESIP